MSTHRIFGLMISWHGLDFALGIEFERKTADYHYKGRGAYIGPARSTVDLTKVEVILGNDQHLDYIEAAVGLAPVRE